MKITYGEMREMGVRGVLTYCHCGHHVALDADLWPDSVRLSDLEPRFVCRGCGGRGAEVRPDFDRGNPQLAKRPPTEAALLCGVLNGADSFGAFPFEPINVQLVQIFLANPARLGKTCNAPLLWAAPNGLSIRASPGTA